jgi:exodeoxyribonuclease VII small subunit
MKTYHDLTSKLDVLLSELQSGQLDIDTALKKYEEGILIVGQLEKQLKTAENTINKLKT